MKSSILCTATYAAVVVALAGCGEPADRGPQATDENRPMTTADSASPAGQRQPSSTTAAQPASEVSRTPSGTAQPADSEAPSVETTVVGTDGKNLGNLSIEPLEQGVRLSMHVEGLAPGPHAVHFHEHGRCDTPDFASAGGHFNPANARHGRPDMDEVGNDQDHHVGDMLNQQADDQETLNAIVLNGTASLATGPNALLDQDGSALIIHAGADDYESQPSGDAGERVACAVIAKARATGTS